MKADYGLTLIEMMISLVTVAILMMVGVPQFSEFLQQIRISVAANDLRHSMALTRAEAVRRNGKVDLVAIDNDWKNGWIITSPDRAVIMKHGPLNSDIKISAYFTDQRQHMAYNGSGHSQTGTNSKAPQSGHIQLTLGHHARIIFVNFLGHVTLCNPASDKACALVLPDTSAICTQPVQRV